MILGALESIGSMGYRAKHSSNADSHPDKLYHKEPKSGEEPKREPPSTFSLINDATSETDGEDDV